jgi:acyl-homoserine lactone acylase PvdQ
VGLILDAYDRAGGEFPDPAGRMRRAVEILRAWDGMATVDNRALPILVACLEVAGDAARSGAMKRPKPGDVLRVLSHGLRNLERAYETVEVPWGEMHRLRRGDVDLPMPGAGNASAVDPFTTLFMAGSQKLTDGKILCDRGSSWMQLVRYHDGTVEAKTILPYGNSGDPASPHYGDQSPLFAERKFKKALLGRDEVEAQVTCRVVLER